MLATVEEIYLERKTGQPGFGQGSLGRPLYDLWWRIADVLPEAVKTDSPFAPLKILEGLGTHNTIFPQDTTSTLLLSTTPSANVYRHSKIGRFMKLLKTISHRQFPRLNLRIEQVSSALSDLQGGLHLLRQRGVQLRGRGQERGAFLRNGRSNTCTNMLC